ncbi:flagellar brake protein [Moorella sulfitireducens]|uniref:flagellar brake protein n=1 Tax=Neomoorella sulfitireducens TaxID=2972948 RepID=UPI0021AD4558|nr:PilZ domain-containing protein [Moorella sulfitireducens]
MAGLNFIMINMPIIIKNPGRKDLRTIIQDVGQDGFAVLAPASSELVLAPGDAVEVTCNRLDARYEFTTTVRRYLPGDPPLYYLAYPDDYRRLQVRSHVRVRAALEFRYAVCPATDGPARPTRLHKKGVTVDISGGGAQLVLREPVAVGDLIYMEFHLPGRRRLPMRLAGRVKRAAPREIDGVTRYEAGVAFEGISERQEDEIVAFVFQRLLEEKRRRGERESGS